MKVPSNSRRNSHFIADAVNLPLTFGHSEKRFISGLSQIETDAESSGAASDCSARALRSTGLEMTAHTVTPMGTVIATYRPGGTLAPYPPEGPIPATSDRETARQARIAAGDW